MARDNSLTPMMEQYFRVKQSHRDALLFFRLGDFYEMFYEDAKIASPLLEIALTSRQKVPMCGVPYHAVDAYLARLVRHGYKVAICEQVEDPKAARGVVKREVIKVLTPGTAVEVDGEDSKENNFIAGITTGGGGWGLALVDLVSGVMRTLQGEREEKRTLADEIFKASPKEIVFPEGEESDILSVVSQGGLASIPRSSVEAWAFDYPQAAHLLLDHFRVNSLEAFGLGEKKLAVSAAGALLYYLKKVRKDSLLLVHRLSYVPSGGRLVLDATTVKNLELVRNARDGRVKDSLLDVIDFTVTAVGGRMLRAWLLQPLNDCAGIQDRLGAVENALCSTIERHELRMLLKGIHDLERLTGKISLAVAHPKDVVALKNSLRPLPEIQPLLCRLSAGVFQRISEGWDNGHDVAALIDRAVRDEPAFLLTEGGIIKDGYSAELDELRAVSRSGKTFIARLENKERERTGIASLKVRYNKVFGYYIEVTKPNLHLVPPDFIRKQTLVNAERFLTPELKEYEEKVLHAEERIADLEYKLFLEVREALALETPRLQKIAADIALLDCLLALAELAAQRKYSRPEVHAGDSIKIIEGRHPVIEVSQPEAFIPNDAFLDGEENQILIITGPNMGGKSTYLRQTALIVILAQMGSFVPAKSASIGLVDRIFTRIGATDFLTSGQSTFMVEMLETANILHSASANSLILLDEIGRGTSTFDGLSIAWAVAEYLYGREDIRPKTLFATHYHELTELALTMKRIKNYHISVKEWKDEIIFLRKIVPGPSDQSYGIHVAKLAGIPGPVIDRAREILFNLEKQELDDAGLPKIAYRLPAERDPAQLLLFSEDREMALLRELKRTIESLDPPSITPLEAIRILSELKEKLRISGKA